MLVDPGAIGIFLSMLARGGRDLVDFTNDVLNNVVSLTGDAHQARVAQDIFRQEIRYERSLQMREDIRDMNKVMLESVTSYLFLGSIILGTCFTTVIEGFPPLDTNRMVRAWWLLFACWAITFSLLGIWFALGFQVKISAASRERLLRRYRYRLTDDVVVTRMGGNNLVNSFFSLGNMVINSVGQATFDRAGGDTPSGVRKECSTPVFPAKTLESALKTRVQSLDKMNPVDATPLRKHLNAWIHQSGEGYAKQTIIDAPYFLLDETLVRCPWECTGEKPLLLRVYGEVTMYIAAQCPPLGTFDAEEGVGHTTLHGLRKAIGAEVPEWPMNERPVVTAGYHPAWRGPSGYGEFQRVEGFTLFISHHNMEIALYKIVLAPPNHGNAVDVIVNWRFKTACEALTVVLRNGHVHCKEEDWPIAEFNEEIRQITPFQDFSGYYLRRGMMYLIANVCLAVLSRTWLIGDRPMWWLENVLMVAILLPAIVVTFCMPINIKATQLALSMPVINQADPFTHDSDSLRYDSERSQAVSAHAPKSRWVSSDFAARFHSRDHSPEDHRFGDGEGVPATSSSAPASYGGSPQGGAGSKWRGTSGMPRTARLATDGAHDDVARETTVNHSFAAGDLATASTWQRRTSPDFAAQRQHGGGLGVGAHGGRDAGAVPMEGSLLSSTAKGLETRMSRCCSVSPTKERQQISPDGETSPDRMVLWPRNAGVDSARDPGSGRGPPVSGRAHQEGTTPRLRSEPAPISTAAPSLPRSTSGIFGGVSASTKRAGAMRHKAMLRLVTLRDLGELPPPMSPTAPPNKKFWCRTRCRRWGKHMLRSYVRWCGSGNDKLGLLDTSTAQALRSLTRFLDILFAVSVLTVVGSPAVDWGREPVILGPIDVPPSSMSQRRLYETMSVELGWERWEVAWPPFFRPTAAALDPSGGSLYVAAGAVVRRFRCRAALPQETWLAEADARGAARRCAPAGRPEVLPEEARGLGLIGGTLVAVGDSGVYEVRGLAEATQDSEVDRAEEGGDGPAEEAGLLGAFSAAVGAEAASGERPRLLAPHALGRLAAATVSSLPRGGAPAASGAPAGIAVVLAPASGAARFGAVLPVGAGAAAGGAAMGAGADVGELRLLAPLEISRGEALQNLTATYLNGGGSGQARRHDGGEPTLWAADGEGNLLALGLSSGKLLATAAVPRGDAAGPSRTARASLRGAPEGAGPPSPSLPRRGHVAALAGNATHLVAVLSAPADDGMGERASEALLPNEALEAAVFVARLPPSGAVFQGL